MYLVVLGWLYVALMMSVAEATSTTGSVIGAFFTFVLYGVLPVALLMYLFATPARRKAIRARQAAELERHAAAASCQPDGGGEAACHPVAPVRKEP